MPEIIPPATGYFCISAVSEYARESGLAQLDDARAEARIVRSALQSLGLEELFPPDHGEQTHEELRTRLLVWAGAEPEEETAERDKTLIIYCTGHGYLDKDGQWYLVPPDCYPVDPKRFTHPRDLLRAVYDRADLAQVVLVLDACFSGDGADQTFKSDGLWNSDIGVDVWVIASARRIEEATPNAFAAALARALEAAASPSWQQAFLNLDVVEQEVADRLKGTRQHARVVTGHDVSGCRALPNPEFMPPAAPAWLTPPWGAVARGVPPGNKPGWFFIPREPAWSDLLGFITDRADRTACVVRGSRGCGKTALLARLVTSATAALRRGMPAVTRRGGLPGTDLAVAAVDARDLSVADVVSELGRSHGTSASSPADLIRALADAPQPVVVVIDHLDDASDPGRLAAEFIEPLRRLPLVRLVVGSRCTELADPGSCCVVDLDDPAQGGASAVERYLLVRLTYGSPQEPGGQGDLSAAVLTLAQACGGNFSAAVVAIESMLAEHRGRRSARETLDAASVASARQMDRLCRQALQDEYRIRAVAHAPEAFADALAPTLSALCSYAENAAPPLPTWVKVAERISGLQLPLADVEACARRAVPFLSFRADGGVIRCRPRYGYAPGPRDPTSGDVVKHLLAVVDLHSALDWRNADPDLMAILAGSVTDPAAGTSRLLDDARFLLAAPPPLVVRTLKAIPDRRERVRRADVWSKVPASGAPDERALILALRAAQAGLTRLTATCEPGSAASGSVRVLWARRCPDRGEYPVIGLAVAGRNTAAMAVTAASNGALTWWDARSGERVSQLPPSADEGTIREVHAAMVHGVPQAVTVSGDGLVHRRRDGAAPTEPAGPQARAIAFHQDGLLALAGHRSIDIVAADDEVTARLQLPSDSVRAMSFAGPPDKPVVWILSADGSVRRWEPGRSVKVPVVAIYPAPVLIVGSDDGAAVVIDADGKPTFPGETGPVPTLLHPGIPDILDAHLSRRWLVMIGGQVDGWMQTCDLVTGRSDLWPLDDPPVAVSGFSEDGELLLVTQHRIAALRLTPGPG